MAKSKKNKKIKVGFFERIKNKILNQQDNRHLDRSILLEETGSPVIMKRILYLTLLFFASFIVWAQNTNINEVAIAEGEIIPIGKMINVQHLEGGIVSELNIKEGDHVKVNQVIMVLDTKNTESQLSEFQKKFEIITARIERLKTFLKVKELDEKVLEKYKKLWSEAQFDFLKQSITSLNSTKLAIQSQIQQLGKEISEMKVQEVSLKKQHQLIKAELDLHLKTGKEPIKKIEEEKEALEEELEIRENLVDKGYNSNVKFLTIQRQYFQIEKDIMEKNTLFSDKKFQFSMQLNEIDTQLKKSPIHIAKKTEKIIELRNTMMKEESKIREQAFLELDTYLEEKILVEENMIRLKDTLERSHIKALGTGRVNKLHFRNEGAVIPAGEVVAEIVPDGVKFVAEVKIKNKDIGHIKKEQKVQLKISTYDFARYGSIEGSLLEISPSTTLDENQEAHYVGRVNLNQNFLGEDPDVNSVLPGMTLQAEIITGNKTVMEYILKPIYASAKTAMRER